MKGDIMNEKIKCLRCGSTNLTPANFESTGKIYSCPKNAKLVTVLTSGVLVDAILCLDCGHIDLVVNAEKARALSKAS
jgi:predicted nucleic-acid-binding Zn-ribbon protein